MSKLQERQSEQPEKLLTQEFLNELAKKLSAHDRAVEISHPIVDIRREIFAELKEWLELNGYTKYSEGEGEGEPKDNVYVLTHDDIEKINDLNGIKNLIVVVFSDERALSFDTGALFSNNPSAKIIWILDSKDNLEGIDMNAKTVESLEMHELEKMIYGIIALFSTVDQKHKAGLTTFSEYIFDRQFIDLIKEVLYLKFAEEREPLIFLAKSQGIPNPQLLPDDELLSKVTNYIIKNSNLKHRREAGLRDWSLVKSFGNWLREYHPQIAEKIDEILQAEITDGLCLKFEEIKSARKESVEKLISLRSIKREIEEERSRLSTEIGNVEKEISSIEDKYPGKFSKLDSLYKKQKLQEKERRRLGSEIYQAERTIKRLTETLISTVENTNSFLEIVRTGSRIRISQESLTRLEKRVLDDDIESTVFLAKLIFKFREDKEKLEKEKEGVESTLKKTKQEINEIKKNIKTEDGSSLVDLETKRNSLKRKKKSVTTRLKSKYGISENIEGSIKKHREKLQEYPEKLLRILSKMFFIVVNLFLSKEEKPEIFIQSLNDGYRSKLLQAIYFYNEIDDSSPEQIMEILFLSDIVGSSRENFERTKLLIEKLIAESASVSEGEKPF